jgi:hypothetical protein
MGRSPRARHGIRTKKQLKLNFGAKMPEAVAKAEALQEEKEAEGDGAAREWASRRGQRKGAATVGNSQQMGSAPPEGTTQQDDVVEEQGGSEIWMIHGLLSARWNRCDTTPVAARWRLLALCSATRAGCFRVPVLSGAIYKLTRNKPATGRVLCPMVLSY